jgi:GT2 family glycosyltransferase
MTESEKNPAVVLDAQPSPTTLEVAQEPASRETGAQVHLQAQRGLAVVIPSKTDAYLGQLLVSMENSEPGSTAGVIVGDNGLSDEFKQQWPQVTFISIPQPFVFAKAINIMVALAMTGHRVGDNDEPDIFVLNDDTEIKTVHWRAILRAMLDEHRADGYGMIACQIDGGVGNDEQSLEKNGQYDLGQIVDSEKNICFVAVLIPAAAWQKIGPLDETFVGYGFDDDDYNRRCKAAGFKCGVAGGVVVQHGRDGLAHSSSYAKYLGHAEWNRQFEFNARMFKKKYGEAVANRLCLNIGCGDHPRQSELLDKWFNMDIQAFPGVQIVRDLKRGIPMPDETFDHVLMDNVLEHFESDDVVFIINEIDRVLKIGGTAEIIVPHAMHGQGAYQDPTHKSYFVPRSVLYWNQELSSRGGEFVGITANLMPFPDTEKGVQVFGNDIECFIRFILKKKARVR